ncbi:MAG: valine--pyruvate transaminase [Cellvibrionaceae bacterium]|nr:valine--pyruvate transaminase [Cellvibrionaceae bacterium]
MKLSKFGEKFAAPSATVNLMDDLNSALNENPDMIFMGGGNPSRLPEVETAFQQRLAAILADADECHRVLGIYQSPQGDKQFRKEMAGFLNKQFGWQLSERNIAVSNGSQSAFFLLFNLFGGIMPDGSQRSIHLPLSPEYLGYADIGLCENFFTATRPTIDRLDNHLFKYRVDFSQLDIASNTAALCVSRPTNPTGNVLTDNEIEHLDAIAKQHDIPLIIDGAYGLPFPNILFCQAKPYWNDNIILALSLSKMGLPGVRTGIVVANEAVIQAYSNANTLASLACGNLGPALVKALFKNSDILGLTRHITPFYQQRSQQTLQWLRESLGDLPCQIHKPEGAIFLWLWFEGLPVSSQTLYERLKKRGVLVVPGQSFFVGIDNAWQHKHECIRLSYAQDAATVKRGVKILAEEVYLAYNTQ